MDHSRLVAAINNAQWQQDSRATFYPPQTGQSKANKMPARQSQAPDSETTAFPGPANLAPKTEAWLSGSVSPKGPPWQLASNSASSADVKPSSVEQPVAVPDKPATAAAAAALPAPPVAPPLPPPPAAQPLAQRTVPLPPPQAKAAPPTPPMPLFGTMREARDWWNERCQRDEHTGRWIVPVTQDMLHNIRWMDWPNMVKDERLHRGEHAMTRIMPFFYMDEADHNRFGRPRLDFVVEFDDGQAVRYHPDATPIWLPAGADNEAIDKRRRYLARVRRKTGGRDWYR